jgi:hypothetical protein
MAEISQIIAETALTKDSQKRNANPTLETYI